jgi:hypothetical protein
MQAVDVQGVQKFVHKLLSGKPCGMLVGDQAVMPKFDVIARRYGK